MASNVCLVDVMENGCSDNFNAVASPQRSSFDISVVASTLDTDRGRLRNRKVHHGALFVVACVIVVSVVGMLVANFSHMTVANIYPLGVRSLLTHDAKVIGGMTFTWVIAAAALTMALIVFFGCEATEVPNEEIQITKAPICHNACKKAFKAIAVENREVQNNLDVIRQTLLGEGFEVKLTNAKARIAIGDKQGPKILDDLHETQYEFFRLADSGEFDGEVPDNLKAKLVQAKRGVKELKKTGDYHATGTTVSIEAVAATGLKALKPKISGFQKYENLRVRVYAPGIEKHHKTSWVRHHKNETAGEVVWDQDVAENKVQTRIYDDGLLVFQLWDLTNTNELVAVAHVKVDKKQLPLDCHLKLTGYGFGGEAFLRVKVREV